MINILEREDGNGWLKYDIVRFRRDLWPRDLDVGVVIFIISGRDVYLYWAGAYPKWEVLKSGPLLVDWHNLLFLMAYNFCLYLFDMLKNVDPFFEKFLGTPLQVLQGTRIVPEVFARWKRLPTPIKLRTAQ